MIKITPQEFHFEDTASSVRVKTAVARDLIKEALLLPHIRHFRLAAGTVIKVQCMSKDYDVLYHSADFVITRAVETRKRIVDETGERTATIMEYEVAQDTDWKAWPNAPVETEAEPERVPERYVPGEGEIRWNPGKKTYEIVVAGQVLAEERDKDKALAMAAGSLPLPEAA